MDLEQFIAIEPSDHSDQGFPVSIAWSLPDGQIKDVLIEPLEDWRARDSDLISVDVDQLYQQGETVRDVLIELQHDCGDSTLYCLDVSMTQRLCEMLFESAGSTCELDISDARTCFSDLDSESFWQEKQLLEELQGLSPDQTFDQVKALLLLYHQHTGQEL